MAHGKEKEKEKDSGPLTHVVLDFSGSSGLDLTTMLSIQYLTAEARRLGVRLVLAECSDSVIHNLWQAGLLDACGGDLTRQCLEEVVAQLEKEKREKQVAAAGAGAGGDKGDVEAGLIASATGAGGDGDAAAAAAAPKASLPFYKRLLSPAK